MAKINRRVFLTGFGSSLLGFGLSKRVMASVRPMLAMEEEPAKVHIKKKNPLGKTGLMVSDVSCGGGNPAGENVIKYAYDCGVNYFDLSEMYQLGKIEILFGNALKDVRDKVIITTKHLLYGRGQNAKTPIKKEAIIEKVEASLKRLQTDYIDVSMIHGLSDLSLINDDIRETYAQLKKQGKIRFTGVSTHMPSQTLEQSLTNDFAEVVLMVYSHMERFKLVEPLIKQAHDKGVGLVAMKVAAGQKEGGLEPFINKQVSYRQAAIRWVLNNPNISNCIPSMNKLTDVEECVAVSGTPLEKSDLALIKEYQHLASDQICRVSCGECLSACPNHVAIGEVLRYGMYFEDYKNEKEAMRYYAELENSYKPLSCSACPAPCESACPFGLSVKAKLLNAHQILSV